MTAAEIRAAELEYCRDHTVYFIETYCHIEDKDRPDALIQPFDLWPMQKEAIESIEQNRKNVILKARQLGFSWLVIFVCIKENALPDRAHSDWAVQNRSRGTRACAKDGN